MRRIILILILILSLAACADDAPTEALVAPDAGAPIDVGVHAPDARSGAPDARAPADAANEEQADLGVEPMTCVAEDGICFGDGCCDGLVCDMPSDSYGPGRCARSLATGASCQSHEVCATGWCEGGICDEPRFAAFARVYDEVLVAGGCTNGYCHGAAGAALSFESVASAYRALVGPSGCEGWPRVAPGDPDGSLLWRKVAPGLSVCGSKMPPAGALSAAQLEILRAWIGSNAPM